MFFRQIQKTPAQVCGYMYMYVSERESSAFDMYMHMNMCR